MIIEYCEVCNLRIDGNCYVDTRNATKYCLRCGTGNNALVPFNDQTQTEPAKTSGLKRLPVSSDRRVGSNTRIKTIPGASTEHMLDKMRVPHSTDKRNVRGSSVVALLTLALLSCSLLIASAKWMSSGGNSAANVSARMPLPEKQTERTVEPQPASKTPTVEIASTPASAKVVASSEKTSPPAGSVDAAPGAKPLPPIHKPMGHVKGQFVRVVLPGPEKVLSLAEIQIFFLGENLARKGTASQSSTVSKGLPEQAIDGNTSGRFQDGSTSRTRTQDDPWFELDLGTEKQIDKVALWNRTDKPERLRDFHVVILDSARKPVWTIQHADYPNPSTEFVIEAQPMTATR